MSGTASVPIFGALSEVDLRFQEEFGANFYADPSLALSFLQANGDLAWIKATDAGSLTAWFLSTGVQPSQPAGFPLVQGSTYAVQARSIDTAGNISLYTTSYFFVYDSSPPVSGVSYPANNAIVSQLASLSGTALDEPFLQPGAITNVGVRLERLTDHTYWNGGGGAGNFVGGVTAMTAGGAEVVIAPALVVINGQQFGRLMAGTSRRQAFCPRPAC